MFILLLKLIGLAYLAILIYGFPLIMGGVIGDTIQQRDSSKTTYLKAVILNVIIQTLIYSIYSALLFKIAYKYVNNNDTVNWLVWIVVFFCNIVPIYNFYVVTSSHVRAGNPNHSVVNADSLGLVVITAFIMFFLFLLFPSLLNHYNWIPFVG